jgi:hypothetical protein
MIGDLSHGKCAEALAKKNASKDRIMQSKGRTQAKRYRTGKLPDWMFT